MPPPRVIWALLYAAAALALLLGLYARFTGLGAASMAADEYYIARSVQNILRTGVPEYVCGGYYPRAIAYQYVVAALSAGGLGIDVMGRWVAAVSGILALPATWLLGKRVGGRGVALAALTVIGVSVWEVEVSRFGRMYAPFQAIFVWYAWFFIRLTIDRARQAIWPLMALAVLGAFTWEGGIFLAVANILAPFVSNPTGRLRKGEWLFIAVNVVVFIAVFRFLAWNVRVAGTEPAFPDSYDPDAAREITLESVGKSDPMSYSLTSHPAWLIAGCCLLPLLVAAARLPWSLRQRWPGAVALALALVAAAFQQFALVASILIVALLLGALSASDLWQTREAKWYWGTLAACAVFWLIYGLATVDWAGKGHVDVLREHRFLRAVYELFRFPDLFSLVLVPWVRAVPMLTALLAVLLSVCLLQCLRQTGSSRTPQDVLMLLLVSMLVFVGFSEPPRLETRYIFFLYPLVIVLALGALARIAARGSEQQPVFVPLAMVGALIVYGGTEDFQPRHLATIVSQDALLRLDVSKKLANHIVPRTDVRGAAEWLSRNAMGTPAVLINAFPGADYYFTHFDFTYIDEETSRFRAYACRRGTYDRWGNLPLLYSLPQLEARIAAAGSAVLVVSSPNADAFVAALARWHPRVAWTAPDGDIRILVLGS
jgi:hypothetical protein